MCGLSGYVTQPNTLTNYQKLMLVIGLAKGIDDRGGDAAGYISISKEGFRFNKKNGTWAQSKMKFLKSAAIGDLCMMHARFATCGKKNVVSAHPFAIRRNNKVVLWGAHNGVIYDAWTSAKLHDRECNVDSQELFELLADQEYETIKEMDGYGVITWIDSQTPEFVNLARISEQSDICVALLEEGGVVWASTKRILEEALELANLHIKHYYELEVGTVYQIKNDSLYYTNKKDLTLKTEYSYWGKYLAAIREEAEEMDNEFKNKMDEEELSWIEELKMEMLAEGYTEKEIDEMLKNDYLEERAAHNSWADYTGWNCGE